MTDLSARIQAGQPIEDLAREFLDAIAAVKTNVARRLADQHPEIADANIHVAAALGDVERVADFLRRDPTLVAAPAADRPWPPLMYTCWSRFHQIGPKPATASLRTVEYLLDHGADPNTWARSNPDDPKSSLPVLYCACESNNVPVVKLLLERGAKPDDGESTYHSAQHAHLECLELLLAHGADISSRHPHWNNTPLYFLAGHHDDENGAAPWLEGFTWLLGHGADPNVTSYDHGETPLHALVRSSATIAAAGTLLDHGALVDAPRSDGRTPYAIAVRCGNQTAVDLLRGRGAGNITLAPIDTLMGACMRADETAARDILRQHPDLMSQLADEDRSLLTAAATQDLVGAIRLMAALGFDLAWEGSDGGTPLHHAAWRGRTAAVRALVQAGAPVNVRDRTFGSSPIAWAAHGSTNCRTADDDYCAVVTLLADAGAEVAPSINRWDEPAVSMASRRVKALLLERGFE